MIIVHLQGGLGNQFDQYSVGRYLAYKLNDELKLDITECLSNSRNHMYYRLGVFNIQEVFATPEEIKRVREKGTTPTSAKELENIQGDVFVKGHWLHNPMLYKDIADILRKEFTLKKPFNPNAEAWRQKILSAECSVSMHFRHGDYAYDPGLQGVSWAPILPLDYYCTCLDILKQRYDNLTVFVFSDNLPWVKENLRLDVPTEFVEDCETDTEEFILMSLCNHNITASSTFSRQAAWLNQNPDKKIFAPARSTAEKVSQFLDSLTAEKKNNILNSLNPEITGKWAWVPYDFDNQPEITQRPIFSLLLVVNNDAANLPATLYSLLNQDYKYYEVIIIDNASTDGSDKICQDAVAGKKNATYKRLDTKVNNAAAWNEAFKAAQGKYVSFLKVGDRFLNNALTSLCGISYYDFRTEFFHMFSWLEENANGNIVFGDKKFSLQRDSKFKEEKRGSIMSKDGSEATRLLHNREINSFLSTKIYNSEFLKDNGIKFDETLADDEAEISFQAEAFSKSKYFRYQSDALYVAPSQSGLCNEIISLEDQSKNRPLLTYQTHIGGKGWIDWLSEEQISGSTEDKKQIEAIKINFPNRKVYYAVYWNDKEGWSKEVTTSEMAGTTGKYKPIMGVAIWLDEADTKKFDIFYRVHKFDGSWTDWAKNGEAIYSHGVKLNAIQIKVATKSDKNSP